MDITRVQCKCQNVYEQKWLNNIAPCLKIGTTHKDRWDWWILNWYNTYLHLVYSIYEVLFFVFIISFMHLWREVLVLKTNKWKLIFSITVLNTYSNSSSVILLSASATKSLLFGLSLAAYQLKYLFQSFVVKTLHLMIAYRFSYIYQQMFISYHFPLVFVVSSSASVLQHYRLQGSNNIWMLL